MLELNFDNCIGCLYRWKLLGNAYTKRIRVRFDMSVNYDWTAFEFDLAWQSIGKEFINLNIDGNTSGGNGLTKYRFSATKPGKATLTFEYRYRMQQPALMLDDSMTFTWLIAVQVLLNLATRSDG